METGTEQERPGSLIRVSTLTEEKFDQLGSKVYESAQIISDQGEFIFNTGC